MTTSNKNQTKTKENDLTSYRVMGKFTLLQTMAVLAVIGIVIGICIRFW